MMNAELVEVFKEDMLPGEHIVWVEKPKSGFRLNFSDFWFIPLGLFAITFMMFLLMNKEEISTPFVLDYLVIPIIAAFAFMLLRRVFGDWLFMRNNTFYAITNKRVIIKSGMFKRELSSINYDSIDSVTFWENGKGYGYVKVYAKNFSRIMTPNNPVGRMGRFLRFQYLDNIKILYRLIEEQRVLIAK